uniref:Uncharacterized protein n=1 Tax=Arundo donax TaxID=35708 RepID=A0A0A9AM36_ARUDO
MRTGTQRSRVQREGASCGQCIEQPVCTRTDTGAKPLL